ATWQNGPQEQTLISQGLGTRTVPFCQFATRSGPRRAGSAPRHSDPSVTARVRCRHRSTTVALVSLLGRHPGSAPAKQDSLHVARIAPTPAPLHCISLHFIAFHCISLHVVAFHCIAWRRRATMQRPAACATGPRRSVFAKNEECPGAPLRWARRRESS